MNRLIILFLLFKLLCLSCFSQQPIIASNTSGRSFCNSCRQLAEQKFFGHAIAAGTKGLKVCTQENDPIGIADCAFNLATVYVEQGNYPEALNYYQQSLTIYQKNQKSKDVAECFIGIGNTYKYKGTYRDAEKNYQSALVYLEKLQPQDKKLLAQCLNNLAIVYETLDNSKVLDYANRSLALYKQIHDNFGMVECYTTISNGSMRNDDFNKALKYCQLGLSLSEQLNDSYHIALNLGNMGRIYEHKLSNDTALKYTERSLKIFRKLGDQYQIANCLYHMSVLFRKKSNARLAEQFAEEGLKLYQQLGSRDGIAACNNALANTIIGQSGIDRYSDNLKILNNNNDSSGMSVTYSNISINYLALGKHNLAKDYAIKALQIIPKANFERGVQATRASYMVDSALGDWKSAFEHHKLYKQYSDSLHNEEKAKEFGRIESRYQFEKEAEEQKRKEEEAKRLAEIETERRNNLQYLSIFAGLMVLFGGLVFIGRFKIPVRVLDVALFASLLILFEFLLILFDPLLDQYTGGIPIQKLIFNSVIALGFAPLHSFLEQKLRNRLTVKRLAPVSIATSPQEAEVETPDETNEP